MVLFHVATAVWLQAVPTQEEVCTPVEWMNGWATKMCAAKEKKKSWNEASYKQEAQNKFHVLSFFPPLTSCVRASQQTYFYAFMQGNWPGHTWYLSQFRLLQHTQSRKSSMFCYCCLMLLRKSREITRANFLNGLTSCLQRSISTVFHSCLFCTKCLLKSGLPQKSLIITINIQVTMKMTHDEIQIDWSLAKWPLLVCKVLMLL